MISRALCCARRFAGRSVAAIDFSSLALRDQDLADLLSALASIKSLSELCLQFNPGLTDRCREDLLQATRRYSDLVRLRLQGTELSSAVHDELQNIIRANAIQRALHVLSSVWHPPMLHAQLEVSCLDVQDLCDEDIRALYPAMLKSTQVKSVDLSGNQQLTDDTGRMLLDVVSSNTSWIFVGLKQTGVSVPIRHQISLLLKSNALEFAKSVLAGRWGGITTLDALKGQNILDDDILNLCSLLSGCSTVSEIQLDNNQRLSDKIVPALEEALSKNGSRCAVAKIHLNGTSISVPGKIKISTACRRAYTKLLSISDACYHENFYRLDLDGDQEAVASELCLAKFELSNVEARVNEIVAHLSSRSDLLALQKGYGYPMVKSVQAQLAEISKRMEQHHVQSSYEPVALQDASKSTIGAFPLNSIRPKCHKGIRLKLGVRSPGSSNTNLKADLCRLLDVSAERIETVSSSTSLVDSKSIFDFNLYGLDSNECNELASLLFSLSEDPNSELCQRHNQGREILCFPWATNLRVNPEEVLLSDSGHTLSKPLLSETFAQHNSFLALSGSVCDEIISILLPSLSSGHKNGFQRKCTNVIARFQAIFQDLASFTLIEMEYDTIVLLTAQVRAVFEKYFSCTQPFDLLGTESMEIISAIKDVFQQQRQAWQRIFVEFAHCDSKCFQLSFREDLLDKCEKTSNVVFHDLIGAYETYVTEIRQHTSTLISEKDAILKSKNSVCDELQSRLRHLQSEIQGLKFLQSEDLAVILSRLESYSQRAEKMMDLNHERNILVQMEKSVLKKMDVCLASLDTMLHDADQKYEPMNDLIGRRIEKSVGRISEAIHFQLKAYEGKVTAFIKFLAEEIYKKSLLVDFCLVDMISKRLLMSINLDKGEVMSLDSKPPIYGTLGKSSKIDGAVQVWSRGSKTNASLGSLSMDEQAHYVADLHTLGDDLVEEGMLFWDLLKNFDSCEIICPGSEAEIMMFLLPNSDDNPKWLMLPNIRSLAASLRLKNAFVDEQNDEQKVLLRVDDYIEQCTNTIIMKIMANPKFRIDLRRSLVEANQLQESADNYSSRISRAEREASAARRTAAARKDVSNDSMSNRAYTQAFLKSKQDLLAETLNELHEAKSIFKKECEDLNEAEYELKKATEMVSKLKLQVNDLMNSRQKAQKAVDAIELRYQQLASDYKDILNEVKKLDVQANEQQIIFERANKKAQECIDHCNTLERDYKMVKRDAAKKKRKVDAHKQISFACAPHPEIESVPADASNAWYIDPSTIVYCCHVWLELKEDLLQLHSNGRQKAAVMETIRYS